MWLGTIFLRSRLARPLKKPLQVPATRRHLMGAMVVTAGRPVEIQTRENGAGQQGNSEMERGLNAQPGKIVEQVHMPVVGIVLRAAAVAAAARCIRPR